MWQDFSAISKLCTSEKSPSSVGASTRISNLAIGLGLRLTLKPWPLFFKCWQRTMTMPSLRVMNYLISSVSVFLYICLFISLRCSSPASFSVTRCRPSSCCTMMLLLDLYEHIPKLFGSSSSSLIGLGSFKSLKKSR